MRAGDLVRIHDPDEHKIDGTPYSVLGILINIRQKTFNANAHRVFTVYIEGEQRVFDEPFWAATVISSA